MLIPETYYHIYNHANGDDNLFREEQNYPFFLEKYHLHIDPIAETIAWCLMSNHFHLVVRLKDSKLLSQDFPKFQTLENLGEANEIKTSNLLAKQFSNFFSSYTQSFNKVYSRRGSLFIKNFKRKLIDNDQYLAQVILYVHLNPVKHGFVNNIINWGWTSKFDFWEKQPVLAKRLFLTKENYETLHCEKQQQFSEYIPIENDLLNTKL
jgi:putative transposase